MKELGFPPPAAQPSDFKLPPNPSPVLPNVFSEITDELVYSLDEIARQTRNIYDARLLRTAIKSGALRAFGKGRSCVVIGGDFKSFFWGTEKIPAAANDKAVHLDKGARSRSPSHRDPLALTTKRKDAAHIDFFQSAKKTSNKIRLRL